jgi:hypothetical protein
MGDALQCCLLSLCIAPAPTAADTPQQQRYWLLLLSAQPDSTAAMPPPQQQQLQTQQQQQWRVDRRIGCISIAMWLGTAVRVYSALTVWENLQSVAAMLSSE